MKRDQKNAAESAAATQGSRSIGTKLTDCVDFKAERRREILQQHWALPVLFVCSLAFHLFVMFSAAANIFPDSGMYSGLATNLQKGFWGGIGAASITPGYPTFLALSYNLFGYQNFVAVMQLQYTLFILLPVLLYLIYFPVLRSTWLAAIAASAYFLDRYTVGLGTVILTEPLSAFSAIMAVAVFTLGVRRKSWWCAIIVGLAFFLNLIIRASFQYLYLCIVAGGLAVELLPKDSRRNWKPLVKWYGILFLTVKIGIWSWSVVTYRTTGSFGLTGKVYSYMMNQTGYMMHLAPDKYAPVRDVYVRELNKAGGKNANLAIRIMDTMIKETGMTREQIDTQYEEINRYLVRHHPFLLLRQFRYTWMDIWRDNARYLIDETDGLATGTGKYEPTAFFRNVCTQQPFQTVYIIMEKAFWGNRGLLLWMPYILSALALLGLWIRRTDRMAMISILAVIGTVMYHMSLHAIVTTTEFGRYKLPVQTLWLSFLVAMILLAAQKAVGTGLTLYHGAPETDNRRRIGKKKRV